MSVSIVAHCNLLSCVEIVRRSHLIIANPTRLPKSATDRLWSEDMKKVYGLGNWWFSKKKGIDKILQRLLSVISTGDPVYNRLLSHHLLNHYSHHYEDRSMLCLKHRWQLHLRLRGHLVRISGQRTQVLCLASRSRPRSQSRRRLS